MNPTAKNTAASIRLAGKSYRRHMRIALGLLVCLAGCSNNGRQDPMDGPVSAGGAICSEPTWLVGSIDPEKQPHFSHVFTVQNQTGEAIRIDEIKADCGCIVSEDSPSKIPANGSVEIKVRFNSPVVPGEFSHMVQVKLGSSEPASLFLKIRGNVASTAALHAWPPSLDFGRMTESETRTRTICVSRHDFSSVEESKLTSNLKGCTLEARRAAHSQTVLVSVTLRGASLSPGSHSGFAIVETSHPTYPSLKIPVKVEVSTIADAFISTLLVDSIAPGAHKSFSLYRSGLPKAMLPKVARVEFKGDPDIQIGLSPAEPGEGLPLWQLAVSSNAKIGEVKKGVIRIGVSARASDKIDVPVLVFVK